MELLEVRRHHDRDADLGRIGRIGAIETSLADADHGEGIPFHQKFLADHPGISAETADPIPVAEHRVRSAQGRAVIFWREQAAKRRPHTQDVEISPGNEFAGDPLGLAFEVQIEPDVPHAEHSAKDLVFVAEIRVHGIGDLVRPVVASVVRTPAPQQHELLGILYRKQAQQQLIHQRKNRRVRSDAQGKRHHRYCHENRRLPERAKSVAKVLNKVGHKVYTLQLFKRYRLFAVSLATSIYMNFSGANVLMPLPPNCPQCRSVCNFSPSFCKILHCRGTFCLVARTPMSR